MGLQKPGTRCCHRTTNHAFHPLALATAACACSEVTCPFRPGMRRVRGPGGLHRPRSAGRDRTYRQVDGDSVSERDRRPGARRGGRAPARRTGRQARRRHHHSPGRAERALTTAPEWWGRARRPNVRAGTEHVALEPGDGQAVAGDTSRARSVIAATVRIGMHTRPRRRRGSTPTRLKASRMAAGSSNCAGVCFLAHESLAGQAWQAGRYP
jgi:hypothetical protein